MPPWADEFPNDNPDLFIASEYPPAIPDEEYEIEVVDAFDDEAFAHAVTESMIPPPSMVPVFTESMLPPAFETEYADIQDAVAEPEPAPVAVADADADAVADADADADADAVADADADAVADADADADPVAEPVAVAAISHVEIAPESREEIVTESREEIVAESVESRVEMIAEEPARDVDAWRQYVDVMREVAMSFGAARDVAQGLALTLEADAVARAWRVAIEGGEADFAACGNAMLDEWSATFLAQITGAAMESIRRELRSKGVCAFGLIAA